MTFEVAVMQPSLDAPVAPEFDSAPFFVFADLITRRSAVFPNPIQYNAICSVTWLVRAACLPKPDVVLAGHFSPEDERLMREIGQRFSAVAGRARDLIESWGRLPLARAGRFDARGPRPSRAQRALP